jgi:hypothetical protein
VRLADLDGAESWPHMIWRFVRRRLALALHAPQRVEPVIADWRAPIPVAGMTDQAPTHDLPDHRRRAARGRQAAALIRTD